MTVHIYNTPTASEHLIKDVTSAGVELTPAVGVSGAVRGEIVIDRPIVEITGSWRDGNYAYIPDFGRYYYIRSRDLTQKDLTVMLLESDPLMSFAAAIQGLPVYVTRTEQEAKEANHNCGWNSYLHDSAVQRTVREFTIVTSDPYIPAFEYPDKSYDTEYQYILGVIG